MFETLFIPFLFSEDFNIKNGYLSKVLTLAASCRDSYNVVFYVKKTFAEMNQNLFIQVGTWTDLEQ